MSWRDNGTSDITNSGPRLSQESGEVNTLTLRRMGWSWYGPSQCQPDIMQNLFLARIHPALIHSIIQLDSDGIWKTDFESKQMNWTKDSVNRRHACWPCSVLGRAVAQCSSRHGIVGLVQKYMPPWHVPNWRWGVGAGGTTRVPFPFYPSHFLHLRPISCLPWPSLQMRPTCSQAWRRPPNFPNSPGKP